MVADLASIVSTYLYPLCLLVVLEISFTEAARLLTVEVQILRLNACCVTFVVHLVNWSCVIIDHFLLHVVYVISTLCYMIHFLFIVCNHQHCVLYWISSNCFWMCQYLLTKIIVIWCRSIKFYCNCVLQTNFQFSSSNCNWTLIKTNENSVHYKLIFVLTW